MCKTYLMIKVSFWDMWNFFKLYWQGCCMSIFWRPVTYLQSNFIGKKGHMQLPLIKGKCKQIFKCCISTLSCALKPAPSFFNLWFYVYLIYFNIYNIQKFEDILKLLPL